MLYQKCKKGITVVLVLAIMMGGLLPACSVSAKRKAVPLTKKNFPDPILRREISEETDCKLGEKIPPYSLGQVDSLVLSAKKRKVNLKGISHLYDLDSLELTEWCSSRNLSKLPSSLTELFYFNHQIEKLVLSHGAKLEEVQLYNNNLKELQVSNLNKLDILTIDAKKLKKLQFFNCKNLNYLELRTPELTDFDLSPITNLDRLDLDGLHLSELNLSGTPNLANLYLKNTELGNLIIPQNKKLKEVTLDLLSENQLAFLPSIRTKKLTLKNLDIETLELTDVKDVTELEIINCYRLKQISFKGCENLKKILFEKDEYLQDILIEGSNKLENLALSDCPVLKSMEAFRKLPLKYLTIENTSIKDFRATDFPDLEYLLFSGNSQKKVEVSSLKKLWHLEVVGEKTTTKLDVSKMLKLEELIWRDGALKKIKFGKSKKFDTINVSGNHLSGAWDLGAYKKLETFVCNDNKITSLTFGKHSDDLTNVYCRNNKIKVMNASYAFNLRNIDSRGNKGIKLYLFVDSEEDCNDWEFGKTAKVYFGIRK